MWEAKGSFSELRFFFFFFQEKKKKSCELGKSRSLFMKNSTEAYVTGVGWTEQWPAALSGSECNALLCDSTGLMPTRGLDCMGWKGASISSFIEPFFLHLIGVRIRLRHLSFQKGSRSSFKVYVLLEVSAGASQRPNLLFCGWWESTITSLLALLKACAVQNGEHCCEQSPTVTRRPLSQGIANFSHDLVLIHEYW